MNEYALQARRISRRNYKLRKAGKLPPLPRCERCGCKRLCDRYQSLCHDCFVRPDRKARLVRLAADQVLAELRGGQS